MIFSFYLFRFLFCAACFSCALTYSNTKRKQNQSYVRFCFLTAHCYRFCYSGAFICKAGRFITQPKLPCKSKAGKKLFSLHLAPIRKKYMPTDPYISCGETKSAIRCRCHKEQMRKQSILSIHIKIYFGTFLIRLHPPHHLFCCFFAACSHK